MPYAVVGAFETEADALEAREILRAGGLSAVLTTTDDMFELRVHEEAVYFATQLLAARTEDPEPHAVARARCPECSGYETRKLPLYALYAAILVIGVAAALAIAELPALAIVVFVVGWPGVMLAGRSSGKYRCARCGWTFER